jgi:hypothetical protein
MLLRNRPTGIDSRPGHPAKGLDHISDESIAVLRWLHANHVEFVLVGAIARAARGMVDARGPVAIVPAPYKRNLERLSRALWSAHARQRVDTEIGSVPIKVTPEKLEGGPRLTLRCGSHDLDIESRPGGAPSYQELLYEANRIVLEPGLPVEVASPEDVEQFVRMRQTGRAPEIKITRAQPAPAEHSQ